MWRFNDFARAFVKGAPLYSQFATRVAREPAIVQLMHAAAPEQRIPVLLFASAHYLLLGETDHPLARFFPTLRGDQQTSDSRAQPTATTDHSRGVAADTFVQFVLERADAMTDLMATRSTQTNEVGRCAWFLVPFALIEAECGPLARIDIGSSAGLTMLFSDLTFDLRHSNPHLGGLIGDEQALTLECDIRGTPPIPDHVPRVNWSVGLDPHPVNVHDDDNVRWLRACVWPDHVERMTRLDAAIDLARNKEIDVRTGDAVTDVAVLSDEARQHGHPVVTTSWVMNYLSPVQRRAFVAELDHVGSAHDLSWVIAESPRETPDLPVDGQPDEDITVISLVTWRRGQRTSQRLATTHPHGSWINWGV